MTTTNTIGSTPNFNPHRTNLQAVDAGTPTKTQGINGQDFESAVVDVCLVSGTLTGLTLEAVYWSDESNKYVSAAPSPDVVSVSAACQFIVNHAGRRFYLKVNAISGASPVIDLNVAGFRGGGRQYA